MSEGSPPVNEVNYFILGSLFRLLERIELIRRVPFENFDPDDADDVEKIVREYIAPAIRDASSANRDAIARSLAFYSEPDAAPFQKMKDSCQELSLPDADCWATFFDRVGKQVFGIYYRDRFPSDTVVECANEEASLRIFDR